MSFVTVYSSFSPIDAHLVCSRLDAAGLLATVTHEAAALSVEGGAFATGGVLVQVPESQADQARELLAAIEEDARANANADADAEAGASEAPDAPPPRDGDNDAQP